MSPALDDQIRRQLTLTKVGLGLLILAGVSMVISLMKLIDASHITTMMLHTELEIAGMRRAALQWFEASAAAAIPGFGCIALAFLRLARLKPAVVVLPPVP